MIFNLTTAKKKMTEELSNISEYGHPSYNAFDTVLSKCGKFELVIDVAPGRRLPSGKYGYKLNAYVLQLAEGVDPSSDDYCDDAKRIADVDDCLCRTKANLFEEIRAVIDSAKESK